MTAFNILFQITNQMKLLSSDDSYKLFVCDIFERLSGRNFNGSGQYGICHLTSLVISSLMDTTSNVIKQNALELIYTFRDCDKEDIVNDVFRISPDIQLEVADFFSRESKDFNFDKKYFIALNNNRYEHKCVHWRNILPNRVHKRHKPDGVVSRYSSRRSDESRQGNYVSGPLSRTNSIQNNTANSPQPANDADDAVSEAITTLKGDVKCLLKILKTDKLSAKNVTDLKIVANQLMSLM